MKNEKKFGFIRKHLTNYSREKRELQEDVDNLLSIRAEAEVAVKNIGHALKIAGDDLKNKRAEAKVAVKNIGHALEIAGDDLKSKRAEAEAANTILGVLTRNVELLREKSTMLWSGDYKAIGLQCAPRVVNHVKKLRKYIDEQSVVFEQYLAKQPIVVGATDNNLGVVTKAEKLKLKFSDWYKSERELSVPNLDFLDALAALKCVPGMSSPATAVRVIDGDTIECEVLGVVIKIRTIGYDSPELNVGTHRNQEVFAQEATDCLSATLACARSIEVRLDTEGTKEAWSFDRYGRLLAHVYADGVLVGIDLLRRGYAKVVRAFPIESAVEWMYTKASVDAKADGVGLWGLHAASSRKGKASSCAIATKRDIAAARSLISDSVLEEIVRDFVIRSKHSLVVHSEGCYHLQRIKSTNLVNSVDIISVTNARPCKTCGGDEDILQLLTEYIYDQQSEKP